ncbi:MAG: hypothetical protein HYY23_12520 [Verrucomicrobia bacterium]|nr:hypothetical protein [Verrucomicrobiota bacterium]
MATQIAYRLALGRSSDEFERLLSDGRIPSHRVGEPTYQLLSAWSNPDL